MRIAIGGFRVESDERQEFARVFQGRGSRFTLHDGSGVETEPQRDLLRALGCTEIQGYLFSPARPAPDIRQLFLSHLEHQAVA